MMIERGEVVDEAAEGVTGAIGKADIGDEMRARARRVHLANSRRSCMSHPPINKVPTRIS